MRASIKEDSQKKMTQTDNKEERLQKTKDLQCMMPLGINYAHRFPKCFKSHIVGLFALHSVSPIQFVAVPIYSISDLYAHSSYNFTLRKRSCERLSLQKPKPQPPKPKPEPKPKPNTQVKPTQTNPNQKSNPNQPKPDQPHHTTHPKPNTQHPTPQLPTQTPNPNTQPKPNPNQTKPNPSQTPKFCQIPRNYQCK